MMSNKTSTFCGFRGDYDNAEIVRGRRTGKGAERVGKYGWEAGGQ